MCRRVQGSQIFKQNWIISIRSRVIVILLILVSLALVGGGCLGWSTIFYMSSGMFRGKESSNRIELSQLVQELLNLGVLGSLQLWGVGGGWMGVGVVGGAPTHVHTHAHMHMHAHACVENMIISCKWPPPLELGKSRGFPMMSYACVCVHSTHPHPPGGGPPISQNSIALELIEIFQFCLKIWNLWRLPPPMGGCIVCWVGGWVDGWGQVKTLKIWKMLTESRLIQFRLKIYDV